MGDFVKTIVKRESYSNIRRGTWLSTEYRSNFIGNFFLTPYSCSSLNYSFTSCIPNNKIISKGEKVNNLSLTFILNKRGNKKWIKDKELHKVLTENLLILNLSNFSEEISPKLPNICSFINLIELDLTSCAIEHLPINFEHLVSLEKLNLSQNSLKSFPDSIIHFTKLYDLNISQNYIHIISDDIHILDNLKILNISGNPLDIFPSSIAQLKNLKEFICWDCNINELPSQSKLIHKLIGSSPFSQLIKLDLHSNNIKIIPDDWIPCLLQLKYLDLSCNHIIYLPENMGILRNLEYLNIRSNDLLLVPPSLARIYNNLKFLFLSQNNFQTPPKTYNGSILSYFSGILPGQYFDTWILKTITRSLTLRNWTSKDLHAIAHSIHPDLLRRHIQKSVSDCGEDISPVCLKLLLLHSYDKKVVLAALTDLSQSYCVEAYQEGGSNFIASLISSSDKDISMGATKVLANLCIVDSEAAVNIINNNPYSKQFLLSVKQLIQQQDIDYFRCFLQLCAEGKAVFHEEILFSNISIGPILGHGATAIVYKGVWNGIDVAVKKFTFDFIDKKAFRTELALLSILNHPNIITSYGGCAKGKTYIIVFKLYSCGNLAEVLHGHNNEEYEMMQKRYNEDIKIPDELDYDLQFENRLNIVINIAKALDYLHQMNIIHRDMKSENILIDKNLSVSITDFGIACIRSKRTSKGMGTPRYMAPELLEGKEYTEKVDVFSFAILCWEILARQVPYESENFSAWELSEKVVQGYRPVIPAEWPAIVSKIMVMCWANEPSKRPSMSIVYSTMKSFTRKSIEELRLMNSKSLKRNSKFHLKSPVDGEDYTSVSYHTQVYKEAANAARNVIEEKPKGIVPQLESFDSSSSLLRKSSKRKSRISILSPIRHRLKNNQDDPDWLPQTL